ncbi:hypothetical protein [Desertivirga arenae]|nr:hypothetical protein [Pedobacter sp. SYSU D00823]
MSKDKKKAPSLSEKSKTSDYQKDKSTPAKAELVSNKKNKK